MHELVHAFVARALAGELLCGRQHVGQELHVAHGVEEYALTAEDPVHREADVRGIGERLVLRQR
jgi:hypothetical protein